MLNQSSYDMDRETVGAIYRHAQLYGEKQITTGDMNYELRKSLVEDLNNTIIDGSKEFDNKKFYICVHEKRDLQMPNAFLRRMIKTAYRPWPEDDTLVFKVIPEHNDVFFCWHLPHRSEMLNIINCPEIYDAEQIQLLKRWENLELEYYGFIKNELGNWEENLNYQGDQLMKKSPQQPILDLTSIT